LTVPKVQGPNWKASVVGGRRPGMGDPGLLGIPSGIYQFKINYMIS
jgi:hypothetical protein